MTKESKKFQDTFEITPKMAGAMYDAICLHIDPNTIDAKYLLFEALFALQESSGAMIRIPVYGEISH